VLFGVYWCRVPWPAIPITPDLESTEINAAGTPVQTTSTAFRKRRQRTRIHEMWVAPVFATAAQSLGNANPGNRRFNFRTPKISATTKPCKIPRRAGQPHSASSSESGVLMARVKIKKWLLSFSAPAKPIQYHDQRAVTSAINLGNTNT